MKKRTIWTIAIIMGLSFMGLLFLQLSYIQEMAEMKKEQFDESVNLTSGGPANATITMSHYIYNSSFKYVPNFGYSAAMSLFILILVAVLAAIQMKVGDKRD